MPSMNTPRRLGRLVMLSVASCGLLPMTIGVASATTPTLPQASYATEAQLVIQPSGATAPTYLTSTAGQHVTGMLPPNNGISFVPATDNIAESVGETKASAYYSAEPGALSAIISASAQPLADPNLPRHSTTAYVSESFQDYVLVNNPDGTSPVELRFQMDANQGFGMSYSAYEGQESFNVMLQASIWDGTYFQCGPTCGVSYSRGMFVDELGDTGSGEDGSLLQSFDITVPSGSLLMLRGSLSAVVTANGASNIDFALGANNNTWMHSFAEALTPGATLTFSSGHDYAGLVPEPQTALLWIGGLALLLLARHRIRHAA